MWYEVEYHKMNIKLGFSKVIRKTFWHKGAGHANTIFVAFIALSFMLWSYWVIPACCHVIYFQSNISAFCPKCGGQM